MSSKIHTSSGALPQSVAACRDNSGKLQTSLDIQQATASRSRSLRSRISRRIYEFFPILDWLPNYQPKKYLVGDIVGGLTIGVMHTTQGIAYALLARVDPAYGLYTSFFPALFYSIFGTSRHASVGSFAIVALMCGMAVDRVMSQGQSTTAGNATEAIDWTDHNATLPVIYTPIQIATTVTFLQGVITLVTAVFCLDFVTKYFSDILVSGFTTGAAVHVAVGQLTVVLGIPVTGVGNVQLFERVAHMASKLPEANVAVIITSVCSMMIIYIGKEIIDPEVKKHSKSIQIPYELILIISGTLVSYTMKLQAEFHVHCVGKIPIGLPHPQLPEFALLGEIFPDAIAIAALSIAIHISMSKMLAKKLKYKINAGQELYAFGIMSTLSGMFTCYPSSTSMGRTLVSVATGSQTQLASLIGCVFVMGIILFFGPLFHTLPMCILASIILMALRRMFQKFDELKRLWTLSKIDFFIWVFAFTTTVAIGVICGLALSMALSLLSVIIRTHLPDGNVLDADESYLINKLTVFGAIPKQGRWHTSLNVTLYRFAAPLSFANVDAFRDSFQKVSAQWSCSAAANVMTVESLEKKCAVLDCAAMKFIDTSGSAAVEEVVKEMGKQQVNIFLVNANAQVTRMLKLSGLERHIHSAKDLPQWK